MGIVLRELGPGDGSAVVAAARGVCGSAAGLERWRWAFERNPAGRRAFVALDGARVVAHYAAVPHAVWIAGHEARFAEVVDSFVVPGRRGLQREGLYARLARALGEAHGGAQGDLVHYGVPAESEWRIGKSLLDYEVVRTQPLLVREADGAPRELPREVEHLERFDHQARWLWDRCAGTFGASAIREEGFLNWRFAEPPGRRYDLLGARDGAGVLRGYAVFREAPAVLGVAGRTGTIVDWLVPPAETEVGEALLRAVQARARALPSVTALLPDWSPWFEWFQRQGFLVLESGARVFNRSFAKKFDELWLREGWWYTLADFLDG